MKIGLTFDLREDYIARGWSRADAAEFDVPETIEAFERALGALGHITERIGSGEALIERLASGARWDMVFNIAEGHGGVGREAMVPAILETYAIPYTFSDPLVCALTLDKGAAKHVLRDLGLPTPDFRVVRAPEDIADIVLPCPLFVKPAREGSSKGVSPRSLCRTIDEARELCARMLLDFAQPILVERYLPGREVTVSILGSGGDARVVGVMEILLKPSAPEGIYSYDAKQGWDHILDMRLACDDFGRCAGEIALRAYRALGLRDAGRVDLRADEHGDPMIIELNALPGLNPENSDLPITCRLAGVPYDRIIAEIMRSALARARSAACAS